ncbi:transducin family protein / WD-40 repeat family protein [Striga hermonthica]|uniref:Transducin family protein / WD-40 repeat family protein n=1 Tax=Striga hermonthica TaxID=68872 RepID=A0A9N7MYE1_STRHE|nr:transducin family protein / WD-40 repeat family protein [Striga hermonthica]
MRSSHIKGILSSFSPNLDLFAISTADGRIKIWDTVKGQVQTEFVDIASNETSIFGKKDEGHLSMDYTCMKWLPLDKKKKRKLGCSLLVLGTGGGDVLALDVSAGQLKWRVNNCHPGGVSAVSAPSSASCVYTAGADGMVCEIESMSGNLLNKFSSTSSAISSLAISPDGKMVATAAGQLKILNSSNHKKLQKFSGHPVPVKCMVFSEDGKYVLSSAQGERYIAVWKIDGTKTKSSSFILAMDHPAVFLDTWCSNDENTGLSVLAVSEMGVCYFWHGKTVDELRYSKPTKIYVQFDDGVIKKSRGTIPNVFAAKLQSVSSTAGGHIFLAHGFIIKPSFEKVVVQSGTDVKLNVSQDGAFLPVSKSHKSETESGMPSQVTALDSSSTVGALLPVPKMFGLKDGKVGATAVGSNDEGDLDEATLCMEDRLRSLGILGNIDDALGSTMDSKWFKGIDLDSSTPHKKLKATVLSMESGDALTQLKSLVNVWQSRSHIAKHVLPWICCILVYHGDYIKSEEPKLLDYLYKVAKSRGSAINSLFQLSGRLQLVSAQINRASNIKQPVVERDEQKDESEDEEADEVVYGIDEDSQTGSDSD